MTENQPPYVLVVDDDGANRYSTSRTLRQAGYVVSEAPGGQEALEQIDRHEFDLVLTEIRMPGMDGIELLRRIKDRKHDAIVVLMTASASLETAVEALRLDAGDYLVKPCSSQDIRASVKQGIERARCLKHRRRLLDAIKRDVFELTREDFDVDQVAHETNSEGQMPPYRERLPEPTSPAIPLGPLTVFPGRYQVSAGGQSVNLTPTEFDLLLYLAAHRGRIVSCHELVREVRGYVRAESEAREAIRPHVSNLRGKLKGMGVDADLVVNVRGIGYRLSEAAEAGWRQASIFPV